LRSKRLLLAGAVLALAPALASAAVRIAVRDGRKIVYNDGVGASSREALQHADEWLAARVRTPSLYDDAIWRAARQNAIDPRLVKSVMLIESGFNPAAVSAKGARGLMQLMPDTAEHYGARHIFDPEENIGAGARHLAYLLGVYGGDLRRSLAAYNAGETAVARYGGVPPFAETQLYVSKGLTAYYGRAALGGGFGRPAGESWAGRPRPVRLLRDGRDRPLITTRAPSRRTDRQS
jgi:soluble lytic murein transglycosylase-like protein